MRIDSHSHLTPRWYRDVFAVPRRGYRLVGGKTGDTLEMIAAGVRSVRAFETDDPIERKLAWMEAASIDRSVVSLPNPWFDALPARAGLVAARRLNQEFAQLARTTKGRLTGLGVLPPGPVSAVVRVISEIAKAPGLVGVITGTRIARRLFDDPAVAPVWAELERTALPVFVHPHYGVIDGPTISTRKLQVAIGYPVETTMALGRLVDAGISDRHPGLRILASHGGGALPSLIARLQPAGRSAVAPLDRFAVDSVVFDSDVMAALVQRLGPNSVLFGTDHPFGRLEPVTAALAGLDDADRALVESSAACAFFDLVDETRDSSG